jgi:hypothetical protein
MRHNLLMERNEVRLPKVSDAPPSTLSHDGTGNAGTFVQKSVWIAGCKDHSKEKVPQQL